MWHYSEDGIKDGYGGLMSLLAATVRCSNYHSYT